MIADMDDPLPLSTLLSQVLVALTVEFDNEFERQLPHRTTDYGSTSGSFQGPWLVSLAMWENCMRFVGEEGVTVRSLEELARTPTNLNGMERWGYVTVVPDPIDVRPKPPRTSWVIHVTPAGRKAQKIWRPLFAVIEKRWKTRFGEDEIGELRESLSYLVNQFDLELPDCLPILRYGLFSTGPNYKGSKRITHENGGSFNLSLSALLSRVLLTFAMEFEREEDLSLAISANVVRILGPTGVRVHELPRLSGVSKETIKMSIGFLEKGGYLAFESDPTTKASKSVRLTAKGSQAQDAYSRRLDVIERRWLRCFGKDVIARLRTSLTRLVINPGLINELRLYSDGWRASGPRLEVLPHYPMITHRGGFPDGA
jgi:DNA-binding MarR family transcriptional regulator